MSIPTPPTKEGYAFTQWYKDSSLTEVWDFENDTVISEITIYAGWEAVIIEHEVTFVLNYDDIDPVVQLTTDGLVTSIPQRAGYVFNGWWLSDGKTGDGEYILAQKWDTSEPVTEDGLVLYAEWVEEATINIQLPAPSISINENVLSWPAIDGALKYEIQVYESDSKTDIISTTVTETSWTFSNHYDAGYYTVKIRSIGDGLNTINSEYVSKYCAHHILGLTSQIDCDIYTSVLTWTAVKNATKYELYIDGESVGELTYTTYDMSDYEAGTHDISIVASRSDYQSSTTKVQIEKKRLRAPNVNWYVNSEDGTYLLKWDSVAHADVYNLNFGGTEIKITNATSYGFDNDAAFWQGASSVAFSMTAVDNEADYLVSPVEDELDINKSAVLVIDKNIAGAGNTNVTGLLYVNGGQIPEGYLQKANSESTSSASNIYADADTTLTITAQTNIGYTWLGWYNGEELITSELSYTFSKSDQAVTYTAKFSLNSEMENFIFTSTPDTCTITGINDNTVTEMVVPDYVTSISKGAFGECLHLESIILPFVSGTSNTLFGYIFGASNYSDNSSYVPSSLKTVVITGGTSIGYDAFYGCSGLTSITIPDSVTSIGGSAFYGCSGLTSITIPDSVMSIGDLAFYGCGGLTSITIPAGVTSIGNYTFSYCDSLTSITIPASVTSIGSYAFYGCRDLTSITIPAGVTSIGEYAFSNCSSLTSITLPAGVTSIDQYAFYDCSSLTTVTFGENSQLTSIGSYAFSGCSSLTSITIPAGVTSIGERAFSGCYKLVEVYNLSSLNIKKGDSSIGYVGYYALDIYKRASTPSKLHTVDDYLFYADGDTVYLVGYTGTDTILTLPDNYDGKNYAIYKYAFYSCGGLTSITIPAGVTSIGNWAFYNCESLTSITIPDSVTSIGQSAFYGCSSLTSITIPDSVTSIGGSAFSGCPIVTATICTNHISSIPKFALQTVILTGGTSIGEDAFRGCSSLASITIPSSVTSIGSYAFYGCSGLTSITIPSSVTSIGDDAFYGCPIVTATICTHHISSIPKSALQTVILTGGSIIGSRAFEDCTSLTSITIPDSVTSIGSYAFSGCYKLVEVYNLSSLNIEKGSDSNGYVGYYALGIHTDANTPSKLHTVDDYIFYADGNTVYLVGYTGSDTALTLPDDYDGKNYAINQYAFYNCGGLISITLPAGVTSIGEYAFYGCSNLTTVTFGENSQLTSIGYDAFYGCSKLTSITIPAGVTSIGEYAFSNCSSLTTVTFGENSQLTSIGDYAFRGCSSLTTVTFGENSQLTSIGEDAFYCCFKLTSITIPAGVTSIGEDAFYGCSNLTTVTFGENSQLTSIGSYAFYGCSSLASITIPAGVTSIGERAFYYCYNLTTVTFGENSQLTSIGYDAFYGCSKLTSITIPAGVTSIGYEAFRGCSSLTSITIPAGVTSIGRSAFGGCSSLESITIPFVGATKDGTSNTHFGYIFGAWSYSSNSSCVPSSLKTVVITGGTSIGSYAFYGCSGLTSITIPDSVTSIGEYAFRGCSSLTSITIPAGVTSIGEYAFSNCSSLTSITIPDSVTSIGKRAFYYCSSLTTVTFGDNSQLTSIGDEAFYNCSSLTSITIPAGVTSIGYQAFYGCYKLVEVYNLSSLNITKGGSNGSVGCSALDIYTDATTPSKLHTVDDYLFYADGDTVYLVGYTGTDTVLTLPENYDSKNYAIHKYAFYDCDSLTSITIPNSVTSIGYGAFYGCSSLTSITIPAGVTRIGDYAFRYCSSLTSITFEGTTAEWNAIPKIYVWNSYTGSYTVYCTNGTVAKDGTVTLY